MAKVNLNGSETREVGAHGVDTRFPSRWSPRAMTGQGLAWDDLAPLFEAARWAPSSINAQPWRFVYSLKGDDYWDDFFNLLADGNKGWAKNTGALLVIVSRRKFEANGADSITHSFDTGAAWMSLALQAHASGIVAHGMQGFNYDAARNVAGLSDHFSVEAMVALGWPGDVEHLAPAYRQREVPSARKPLSDIVFNGRL